MKLTKLEKDILLHRLSVPDCIHEALTGSDESSDMQLDEVATICCKLINSVTHCLLPEQLDAHECAVLADAVDGSTWIGTMIGEESDAKIARHARAGDALAEKVSSIVGFEVYFPNS